MTHMRESRPVYGLDFRVRFVLEQLFPLRAEGTEDARVLFGMGAMLAGRGRSPFPNFLPENSYRNDRGRANSAHTRQWRTDSGPGIQLKPLKTFIVLPSPLASGLRGLDG